MLTNYTNKLSESIVSDDRAISLLRSEDIVILPTETVYGLGGSAFSHHAVKKIFETKKRPYKNPLIVHYSSIDQILIDTFLTDAAILLAKAFWPGPLTLVLKKRRTSDISSLCTANSNTIAVRIPSHPSTLNILKKANLPIAMPSANTYQKVSPTNVLDAISGLKGVSAIEGGYCKHGIESTIIDCTKKRPIILRHGCITSEMIFKKTQLRIHSFNEYKNEHKNYNNNMPGSHKKHYSTKKDIRLNATKVLPQEGLIAFGDTNLSAQYMINLSRTGNLKEAARKLFYSLQKMDRLPCKSICISPIPNEDIGIAINDRLAKASFRYTPEQSAYFINQQDIHKRKKEQKDRENMEYYNSIESIDANDSGEIF